MWIISHIIFIPVLLVLFIYPPIYFIHDSDVTNNYNAFLKYIRLTIIIIKMILMTQENKTKRKYQKEVESGNYEKGE